ncbi:MAG: ABC transporter permease subunit [Fidelibacterota bacterium]
MKRTVRIFRKEIKDTLRDRRTLMMMVVMPLVIVPLLITVVVKVQQSQMEKAAAKRLNIAFVGREYVPELFELFDQDERFNLVQGVQKDSVTAMTSRGELDGAVVVTPEFPELISADKQGKVQIVFKSSEAFGIAKDRLSEVIEDYDRRIVDGRIERLNLDKNLFDAVAIEKADVASAKERIGKLAGGYLPYLFIIFGFMGAMYPGIDLGAGEKERGTLETLLSSPASRLEIVIGKFFVVMLAGVATALIAMGGLYIAVRRFPEIPPDMLDVIMEMLGLRMVLMVLSLLLPIAAFFAAVILSLSIFAKSFKEAQSIITPLNVAIVFPALIGTLPGIELDARTALVPILNVSLATKDMLAGTVQPVYLIEVYVSLFAIAALSLWGCVRWFNREATLFRS